MNATMVIDAAKDTVTFPQLEMFIIGEDEEAIKTVTEDPALASLQAVQNGRVFNLPLSYVYTSGVRTILGLNAIGAALYPELYSANAAA